MTTEPDAATVVEELGKRDGTSAASWFFTGNNQASFYRLCLKGIEDGDPEVLDTFPTPTHPAASDDPSVETRVIEELGWDRAATDDDELDKLVGVYIDSFNDACGVEIERMCRMMLEPI